MSDEPLWRFGQILVGVLLLLTAGIGIGSLWTYFKIALPWKQRCIDAENTLEVERR
mgnify:CR=1 FL=1